MESAMGLNPTQIHLLRMFAVDRTETSLAQLKKMLFDFYCKEVVRIGKQVAEEQHLTDEVLEQISMEHNRIKE